MFAGALFISGVQAQSQPFLPVQSPSIRPDALKNVPAPQQPSQVVPASSVEASPAPAIPAALPPQNQQPRGAVATEEGVGTTVSTELPGPQRLFLRESEAQFFNRIANDVKKQPGGNRAIFPEEKILTRETFQPRKFPKMVELVEPSYVCHGRLYFEQPNFERAGYDFGVLQPAISVGVFYYDAALFPYHFWTDLSHRTECNVGKCLPGDPSPLVIPRERFSVTGLLGQTGSMIGLGFLFP